MSSIKNEEKNICFPSNQASFVTQAQHESLKIHLENLIKISLENRGQKPTKANVAKATFVSWCEKSDVNGIAKIFQYENIFVRFILFVILLLSLSFTALFMSRNILDFLEHGVVSKILVVYEQPTEFPAVTFCDNQPFTTGKGIHFVNNFYNSFECKSRNCSKYSANLKASDPSFNDEKRKELGLNINQIKCDYSSNCSNDLHWLWNFDYGNCFQFNIEDKSNNKTKASLAGFDYGLRIDIKNFTNVNISKVGVYRGSGIRVFIHNKTLKPRWYEEGVYVRPGEYTLISVKRTSISNAPSPYTDCIDLTSYSSVLYDFIINSNRTYRQKDCFDLCVQLETISQCGCYFTGEDNPLKHKTKPCLNLSEYDCYVNVFFKFNPAECASVYCPLECNSIEYDLSLSSTISPTLNEYNSLNVSSSLTYEEWRTQNVHINVFYSKLEYTFIEETPAMTLTSLIANLGGTMGLIVSLSFFTLLEIVELFLLFLHFFYKKSIY